MPRTNTSSPLISYRKSAHAKPGTMRRVLLLLSLLLALVVFANVIAPQLVSAETFSGTVILGFNQPYGATDTNHLGVDVTLPAGSALYAPVGGTVSYVGSVPAAAPAGQKVTALTITTEAGHLVTLNPCANTAVAKGAVVTKGQKLGSLSGTGDPSSARPHVHLSLRIDGVYRDPSGLIGAVLDPAAPVTTTPPPVPKATTPIATPPTTAPVLTTAPSPAPAQPTAAPRPAPQPRPSPSSMPAPTGVEGVGAHPPITAVPTSAPTPQTTPSGSAESGAIGQDASGRRAAPTRAPLARIPGVASFPSFTDMPSSPQATSASSVAAPPTSSAAPVASSSSTASTAASSSRAYLTAWLRTLTKAQWAGLLYLLGVGLPCLGIGIATVLRRLGIPTVLRRLGLSPQRAPSIPLGTHLFAARAEK